MSKIVLVTIVHNRRHLVGEAIQSAINQTLSKDNWIHLVLDNASTDGADKVAEAFGNKYEHINFFRMGKNLHQMKAYNWALKWIEDNHPEAEIMAHLDSDDILLPNALQEVATMFKAHPEIGQTYSGFNIINKGGAVKHKNHAKAKLVKDQFKSEGQLALRRMFIKANPIGHFRAMRIKFVKKVGGFDETRRFSTDYNMAGKMLEKFPVVKINKVLYNWRQHDTQVERQHSPEQTKNWQQLQIYYKKRWKELGII